MKAFANVGKAGCAGQPVERCFQCHKCTAGCPLAQAMDVPPSRVMRLLQCGDIETLLSAASPWLCAGCETCYVRCPNEIDIPAVMDALKQEQVRARVRGQGRRYAVFHRVFMAGTRWQGRLYELGLMGLSRLFSMDFTSDLMVGLDMFRRGKLKLFPERPRGTEDMKRLYRAASRRRESS